MIVKRKCFFHLLIWSSALQNSIMIGEVFAKVLWQRVDYTLGVCLFHPSTQGFTHQVPSMEFDLATSWP
jgi:hypothetical protein